MPVFFADHSDMVHPDRSEGAYIGFFRRSHFTTKGSKDFGLVDPSGGVTSDMLW